MTHFLCFNRGQGFLEMLSPTCVILAAKEDQRLAATLGRALRVSGIRTSFVSGGERGDIPAKTQAAIDSSLFVLVVVSEFTESDSALIELIKFAFSRRKTLLPYKTNPGRLGNGLQILLGQSHWLDVSTNGKSSASGISILRETAEVYVKKFHAKRRTKIILFRVVIALIGTLVLAAAGAVAFSFLSQQTESFALLPKKKESPAVPAAEFVGEESPSAQSGSSVYFGGVIESDEEESPSAQQPLVVELGNGVAMKFVRVPANEKEKIAAFALGETEVTQAQYREIMGENPSYFKGDELPVEMVYWFDALEFCKKLTKKARAEKLIGEQDVFALPTWAQWKYAADAVFACPADELSRVGWWKENALGETHPVGKKEPDALGLYDMCGNVWEFVFHPQDLGWVGIAGGCFGSESRVDFSSISESYRAKDVGFRVALVPEDSVPTPLNTLFGASGRGDLAAMESLLKSGVPADEVIYGGVTSLFAAAGNGRSEVVRLLLEYGADPNKENRATITPLVVCLISGKSNPETVELLCDYGADVNDVNQWNCSALDEAFVRDLTEEGKVLCAFGAKLSSKQGDEKEKVEPWKSILAMSPTRVPTKARTHAKPAGEESSSAQQPLVVELGNGVAMKFVRVPANEKEKIPAFALGETEVTQEQYREIMGENPSYFKGDELPVEMVYWFDALEFCEKLTKKAREKKLIGEQDVFTLPTRAQWEHAADAVFACPADELSRFFWLKENALGETHLVGQKEPNALGLYDMRGNVWEFVSSLIEFDRAWIVGGSFGSDSGNTVSNTPQSYRAKDVGFRVALVSEDSRQTLLNTLFDASMRGDFSTMERLLKSGVPADEAASGGITSLFAAAGNGRSDIVRLLLEYGANPNHKTTASMTPLVVCLISGKSNPETVELLCDYGADVNDVNRWNRSALDEAFSRNLTEEGKVLCAFGAKLNSERSDEKGRFEPWKSILAMSPTRVPTKVRTRAEPAENVGESPAESPLESPAVPADESAGKDADSAKIVVFLGNGIAMKFVRIPADEKEKIAAFALGETEVTQAQFRAVMRYNPSFFKEGPVENLSYVEALTFCEKMTALARSAGIIGKKDVFTLPTAEQWEYACRAGTKSRFFSGNTEADLAKVGWFGRNTDGKPRAVGLKPPNAWGLYDMHGNVWEFVLDRPSRLFGDLAKKNVFFFGGYYGRDGNGCCSDSFSGVRDLDYRAKDLGFRVALITETSQKQATKSENPVVVPVGNRDDSAAASVVDAFLETVFISGTKKIPAFRIGKYEVTQAQYREITGKNPSRFKGDKLPVEMVSWNDALEFCKKLTAREREAGRIAKNQTFTLPTSAQWEYACRAGTVSHFYTGSDEKALSRAGWYARNSSRTTHPVGQKEPNDWGLYDTHGNVWEWCADKFETSRIVRGGSWTDEMWDCRASDEFAFAAATRSPGLGFRVVLVPAE